MSITATIQSPHYLAARSGPNRLLVGERFARYGLMMLFVLVCLMSAIVAAVLLGESYPVFSRLNVWRLITDSTWHPMENSFNLKPMIVGSLLSAVGSVFLAVPFAIGIASYVNYYAPSPIALLIRRVLYVTASVPTVVFGFWGLTTLVPVLGQIQPPGASLLAGILILTLMIVPTTTLLADVTISKIPRALIQGAFALGASNHRVCFSLALKLARGGLISAALLGLGRSLGETIVVVMVMGNKTAIPAGVFDSVRTLTANVALEIGYADSLHSAVLFFSIFILIGIATALALIVYLLESRSSTHGEA